MQHLIKENDECSKEPDPNPDNPVITIDTSCSIPPGAEYHEVPDNEGRIRWQFYTLNGHEVGPEKSFSVKADGSLYASHQACRNVDGLLIGWEIFYFDNGNISGAIHYENGVKNGHGYGFYEDGTLRSDLTCGKMVSLLIRLYTMKMEA